MKLRKVLIPFAILMLFAPTVAFAATTTPISASLDAGTLSITPPSISSPFTGTILNGQVQTSKATLSSWNVTDATGTGDGWSVTLSASQFTELAPSTGFASGTSALTLPSGSLALSGSRTVVANSGATPVSSTDGPYFMNQTSAVDTSIPIQILTALAGYGMGSYNVTEPTNGLLLTLQPSTTKVDLTNYPNSPTPYQSTLTWTVATGPQATPPTVYSGAFSNDTAQQIHTNVLFLSVAPVTTINATLTTPPSSDPTGGVGLDVATTQNPTDYYQVVFQNDGHFVIYYEPVGDSYTGAVTFDNYLVPYVAGATYTMAITVSGTTATVVLKDTSGHSSTLSWAIGAPSLVPGFYGDLGASVTSLTAGGVNIL